MASQHFYCPQCTDFTYLGPEKFELSNLDPASTVVLHSPAYRVENAGALRQDWARVPLPKTREALEVSAALGQQIAALLDVETPVPGVTQSNPLPELRSIALLTTTSGGAPDFTINVNWGYFGSGSAVMVMPGRGHTVEYQPQNTLYGERGPDTQVDVFLNASTYGKASQLPFGSTRSAGIRCSRSG